MTFVPGSLLIYLENQSLFPQALDHSIDGTFPSRLNPFPTPQTLFFHLTDLTVSLICLRGQHCNGIFYLFSLYSNSESLSV